MEGQIHALRLVELLATKSSIPSIHSLALAVGCAHSYLELYGSIFNAIAMVSTSRIIASLLISRYVNE